MLPSFLRLLCCVSLLGLAMMSPAAAQDATSPAPQASAQDAAGANRGAVANGPAHSETLNGKIVQRVGKDVTPPGVIYDPDPRYPDAPRYARFQASVILWLIVDSDGSPKRIRVQQSAGFGLDEAAIEAVKTWRFHPAMQNGEPVAVMINVEVNFRLTGLKGDAPLHAPPEASRKPPQFPGIDVANYPLVLHIDGENGVLADKGYQIVAEATLHDTQGERSFTMMCNGPTGHCSYLNKGNYPARWKTENRELEIMGIDGNSKDWKKAEYSLKADSAASQSTP
jgi:TonB family protein